jgi:hypothetical protein
MVTSLAQIGAGATAGMSLPVKYGTLTPWIRLGGDGTLGNPRIDDVETLGNSSAGETALAAPVGAFAPGVGMELAGNGPWHLGAAWNGQYGSAASVESFNVEGSYVW